MQRVARAEVEPQEWWAGLDLIIAGGPAALGLASLLSWIDSNQALQPSSRSRRLKGAPEVRDALQVCSTFAGLGASLVTLIGQIEPPVGHHSELSQRIVHPWMDAWWPMEYGSSSATGRGDFRDSSGMGMNIGAIVDSAAARLASAMEGMGPMHRGYSEHEAGLMEDLEGWVPGGESEEAAKARLQRLRAGEPR